MFRQRGFAEVNGTRLYYETAGEGYPLVLIHGFSFDNRMWDDHFEVLAQRFHVIRYDLRGFGQSALPGDQPYTHADDLKALLEFLGVASASLIGLSLGGWVATNFALAYPETTHALVLVDSVLLGLTWSPEYLAAVGPVWQQASEGGIAAAKALWLQVPLFIPALAQPAVATRLAQMVGDYSGWHFVNPDPHQAVSSVLERLGAIAAPTLVIVGEYDLPDFHLIADTLQQIPDARKVVMAGVGHMACMEDPLHFTEIILDFLGDPAAIQTQEVVSPNLLPEGLDGSGR